MNQTEKESEMDIETLFVGIIFVMRDYKENDNDGFFEQKNIELLNYFRLDDLIKIYQFK